MNERRGNIFIDAFNSLRGKFRKEPPTRPELSLRQAQILTLGVQMQAEGIEWWQALQMFDAMREHKYINRLQKWDVHADLARLQRYGLVKAQWNLEHEHPYREFQVSDDGRKERSKVLIPSKLKNIQAIKNPLSEPT